MSLLVAAPVASAGTIGTSDGVCDFKGPCRFDTVFEARPGERNALVLTPRVGFVTVRDEGAPLAAGEGCTSLDANAVDCPIVGGIRLLLGDEADSVRAAPRAGMEVLGGSGDDVITDAAVAFGGEGDDVISGTEIGDRLGGGPGRDALAGSGGDDSLDGDGVSPSEPNGAPAADRDHLDGGPGRDDVVYARGFPVRVDLADPAGDGSPGEEDELESIEGARGGAGDDVLIGDAGANVLAGGSGDDLLVGGEGPDTLDGSTGNDSYEAGGGNDVLSTAEFGDRLGERVECGLGFDRVRTQSDAVLGCEQIGSPTLAPIARPDPVATAGDDLVFRLPCDSRIEGAVTRRRCRIVVYPEAPDGRRTRTRGRLLRGGGRIVVPVRRPATNVRITVVYLDAASLVRRLSWSIALPGSA